MSSGEGNQVWFTAEVLKLWKVSPREVAEKEAEMLQLGERARCMSVFWKQQEVN